MAVCKTNAKAATSRASAASAADGLATDSALGVRAVVRRAPAQAPSGYVRTHIHLPRRLVRGLKGVLLEIEDVGGGSPIAALRRR